MDRNLIGKLGELSYLAGFALFFVSTVVLAGIDANRLSIIAIITLIISLFLLVLGQREIYNPAFGFLGKRKLDEREMRLSAKATQWSTYALLAYIFSLTFLVSSSITVTQALLGAFYLLVVVSGVAFQILLHTAVRE